MPFTFVASSMNMELSGIPGVQLQDHRVIFGFTNASRSGPSKTAFGHLGFHPHGLFKKGHHTLKPIRVYVTCFIAH